MMRRVTLGLAVLGVIAVGCQKGSGPGTAGSARGTPGSTYTVTVRGDFEVRAAGADPVFLVTGGKVTSADGRIDCGIVDGVRTSQCSADFQWDSAAVVLTATGGTGYGFHAFAGDCSGTGTCALTAGNADKMVLVRFAKTADGLGGHPNLSDGKIHGPLFANRATNGLDCFKCHGAQLQGVGIAIGCNGCHRTPSYAPPAQPTLAFSPAAPLTGTLGVLFPLSALATDPAAAAVTCTWSLASKPAASAVTLAASTPCSGTPGIAAFTPDVAGTYVVRVTASNGAPAIQATILVAAQQFDGGAVAVGTDVPDAELTEIANRLHAVLAGGWNSTPPQNVAKSLAGLDTANPATTYAIVDVRLPEDFAAGHIPGAVNAPLAQLPDVLLANPTFPENATPTKKVIVAGYNAGDSTMGAVLFNSARWTGTSGTAAATANPKPATALQYGMSGWTFDRTASPTRFDDDENVRRYQAAATDPGNVPTTSVYAYTSIGAFTGSPTTNQKILVRARAFLRSLVDEAAATGVPAREAMWTTFVKLNALRNDGDPTNDPQMLDVRSAAAYKPGHVPGAFFIAYQQVARLVQTTDALAGVTGGAAIANTAGTPAQPTTRLVDPSRKVFVQCVTGHTGGHATMVLGILGYQARNVLYGINGWTASAVAQSGQMQNFDNSATGNDFPMTTSTDCNPGNSTTAACLAPFVPSRSGCVNCHVSYMAHFADVTQTPIPGAVVEVASEGEG